MPWIAADSPAPTVLTASETTFERMELKLDPESAPVGATAEEALGAALAMEPRELRAEIGEIITHP